jgi:hypothetical protein
MSKGTLKPKRIEKLIKMGRLIPVIGQDKEGKPQLLGYKRKSTSRKRYQRLLLPEEDRVSLGGQTAPPFAKEGEQPILSPEVIQLFDEPKGGETINDH